MKKYSIQLNQKELNDDYFSADLSVFKLTEDKNKHLIFNRNIKFCWYKGEGLNDWCHMQTQYADIAERIRKIELTKDPKEKGRLIQLLETQLESEVD